MENSAALAGTQVPWSCAGVVLVEVVQGSDVSLCEIENVDVVTDASAVWRIVVITEDEELLSLARGDLCEQGKEVEGNTLGVFAHEAGGVGTSGVEVAKDGSVPLLGLLLIASLLGGHALSGNHILDGVLNGNLGMTVGICGVKRAVLRNGDHVLEAGRIAIDSRRRREDDLVDIMLDHALEEVDRTTNIDAEVLKWLLHRFTNGLGLFC